MLTHHYDSYIARINKTMAAKEKIFKLLDFNQSEREDEEDLLAKENPKHSDYIQALKKADQSDFTDMITIHQKTHLE